MKPYAPQPICPRCGGASRAYGANGRACVKCGAFGLVDGRLVQVDQRDRQLDGYGLSKLAGSFVGASLPQAAYQSGSVDEATLAGQFGGTLPPFVDAFVSATGDPTSATKLIAPGGNVAAVTQVVDDPANPGQFTIKMLGGAQVVPWGQMAAFRGLSLVSQADGGHGLQVWWMYDQAGTLQVKAPPGTDTSKVPAGSPVTTPPVAPGQTGSGLPAAPAPTPPGGKSDHLWIGALVVLLALGAVVLWFVASSATAARKQLAGF